jgi:hypothetical protein
VGVALAFSAACAALAVLFPCARRASQSNAGNALVSKAFSIRVICIMGNSPCFWAARARVARVSFTAKSPLFPMNQPARAASHSTVSHPTMHGAHTVLGSLCNARIAYANSCNRNEVSRNESNNTYP